MLRKSRLKIFIQKDISREKNALIGVEICGLLPVTIRLILKRRIILLDFSTKNFQKQDCST